MIDVEKLAREADCAHVNLDGDRSMAIERLSRFAALVLEQAAQKCEEIADKYEREEGRKYPEMRSDANQGAASCEYTIRAMKPEAK